MEIWEHLDAIIARMFNCSGLPFSVAKNPYYQSSFSLATRKKEISRFPSFKDDSSMESHLSAQIARIFYSSGLSSYLARNPYCQSSFSIALMTHIPGYVPPEPKQLNTALLQQERAHIESLLKTIRSTWGKAGVSIIADGWSDGERRPIINILAVTECGPAFLAAIINEDGLKTKERIAEKLISAIEDVGPENVVQVITDNYPVCRDAGALIEEKYSHIQWTPSVAHTLSLALKSICSAKSSEDVDIKGCHWISDVVDNATIIKNFIINHTMMSSIFNEFSKLKMLIIADTRFASDVVMLKRLRSIKESLQRMIISDQWSAYRQGNVEQAHIVKRKVADNMWWEQIDYILAFTEPIYSMIRMVDTDKSCLHLIHLMWNYMTEKVKAAIYDHEGKIAKEDSAFYSVVHGILVDWRNKSKTPLHCLSHTLNPRCYTVSWIAENANHVPPHRDIEISDTRNRCWKKLFPTADVLKTVKEEYGEFARLGTKSFGLDSMVDRDKLDPKTWWLTHGASAPNLQSLALKLLSQPASSSCYERNWSTYSLIHKIMKSKLHPEWADDLVFVHTNLRLLSRTSEYYLTDPQSRPWDVGGDDSAFGSILKSANFSLDEPEFELAMLEDTGHEMEANWQS